MDAGKRLRIPGLKTKTLLVIAIAIARVFLQDPTPIGCHEDGQVTSIHAVHCITGEEF